MFIYPINVEGFYFSQLPDNIQSKIVEDKITSIIKNLDNEKYSKYKKTIDIAKNSATPLQYREFIKKYNHTDLIKDINSSEKLYDLKGNPFNIIKKGNNHVLFLTKTTSIPVKIIEGFKYNVYLQNKGTEIPTTTLINVKAPSKKIAKEIALSKFVKNNKSKNKITENYIHKID